MADEEIPGQDYTINGTTYRIPKLTDTADAVVAFEDYSNSIPFSEYIQTVTLTESVTITNDVDDPHYFGNYNGKMIVAQENITLTFGTTENGKGPLENGFSVACVADEGDKISYDGVDKEGQTTDAYEVATVVTVNGKNILSVARATSNTPDSPAPDPTPGAAVIGTPTADPGEDPVVTYSYTRNGQSYDVYEFYGTGTLPVIEPGFVDALVVAGGGGGGSMDTASYTGGGGGAGSMHDYFSVYVSQNDHKVVVGAGGAAAARMESGFIGGYSGFDVYNLPGGGGGGGYQGYNIRAGDGGSGGGAGGGFGAGQVMHGVAVLGDEMGHPGGNNDVNSSNAPGGGGGAGSKGGDATGSNGGGVGGDGRLSEIPDPPRTFAAGGGGHTSIGGSKIGGDGALSTNGWQGQDGADHTGSGGGGGYSNQSGKGADGIVIVRVATSTTTFAARTAAPKTAHAARIENGVVRQVIVIPHLDNDDNKITEYCNKIGLPGTWVDTSYTGARRGKYAGVGDLFDPRLKDDEFKSPVMDEE